MGEAVDQRSEATRLGSYEILRKLARGGMAELFLARTVGPEGFEKLVVLKKILPTFAENPKFVRLFLDEARLAATLDHPHIAHVYDMGKVEGNYFFTMEYIHGQDVRATLRRTSRIDKKFPIDHAIQIAHSIASALHYAHERRTPDGRSFDIVHRDVSPSNVLISYDGAVKLVDFGVAKAATSSVKTRTGTLKGKISYMSPEQAKGSPIDRRSDIFSLGIVLWEMLTTQRLFKADNDLATIQLIINSKPQAPTELRPECPPELERIVLKALSADLAGRYQTAEELQLELEELAREHKLKQSSIALRAHMHDLFAEEILAWKSAQASGLTLTDHVVSASVVEMTTPVSENEVSFLDDDEDDDGSQQQPTQGVLTVTTNIQPAVVPPPPAQPSVVVGRVDHTPIPRSGTIPPSGVLPPNAPTAMMPVGAVDQSGRPHGAMPNQTGQHPHVAMPGQAGQHGAMPNQSGQQDNAMPNQSGQQDNAMPNQSGQHAMNQSGQHAMPNQSGQHAMNQSGQHAMNQSGQHAMPNQSGQHAMNQSGQHAMPNQSGPNQSGSLAMHPAIPRTATGPITSMNPYPAAPVPIGHQPSGPIRQLSHTPSGAVRMPTMPPGMHESNPFVREQATSEAGFPIAPREWRETASPELDLLRQRRAKQLLIGGTLALAIGAILALVLGGATPPSASAEEMKPEPVTRPADDTGQNAGQPMGDPSKPDNATGSDTAKSDTTKPDTAKPDTANPDTSNPDTAKLTNPNTKPDTTKPDTAKLNKPDTKPDTAKLTKPDTTKPDTAKLVKPDTTKPDTAKLVKPDTAKPDSMKTKPDTAKVDGTKPDAKIDAAKTTKVDPNKTKSDATKLGITTTHHTTTPDATKVDTTKIDPTKAHHTTPKPDTKTPDKKDPHSGSAHYDPNSALPPP